MPRHLDCLLRSRENDSQCELTCWSLDIKSINLLVAQGLYYIEPDSSYADRYFHARIYPEFRCWISTYSSHLPLRDCSRAAGYETLGYRLRNYVSRTIRTSYLHIAIGILSVEKSPIISGGHLWNGIAVGCRYSIYCLPRGVQTYSG